MPVLPSRSQLSQYGPVNRAPRVGRQAPPPPIILQTGPALGTEQTKDRQVGDLQQRSRQANSVANASPLLGAATLEGISLKTGDNVVGHGLPQAWKGCILTTPSVGITYSVSRLTPTSLNDVQLKISVSHDLVCTLVVW